MSLGILCKKIGMTTVFTETGDSIPVTVLKADPSVVTAIKTKEKHGYEAVQVAFDAVAEKKLTKAEAGVFKAAGVAEAYRTLREFRIAGPITLAVGAKVTAESILAEGDIINVEGTSIGKGFQGPVKKYHFNRGRMSHGSQHHRIPGSSGSGTTPGHVGKGMRRASQMGNVKVTTKGLKVVKLIPEDNLVLVKGSVPGYEGSLVCITKPKAKWN
jgi:large subunit ribosomal protein L3